MVVDDRVGGPLQVALAPVHVDLRPGEGRHAGPLAELTREAEVSAHDRGAAHRMTTAVSHTYRLPPKELSGLSSSGSTSPIVVPSAANT